MNIDTQIEIFVQEDVDMVKENPNKIAKCPYCGSERLTKIDWGFADWECETCRNNFKRPYYPKDEPKRDYGSNEKKYSIKESVDSALGYSISIFLILCVVVSIIFFFVRIYQIFIVPFL